MNENDDFYNERTGYVALLQRSGQTETGEEINRIYNERSGLEGSGGRVRLDRRSAFR